MLDGANGVGALKVNEIKDKLDTLLKIQVYNSGNGILNYKCGADFVKVFMLKNRADKELQKKII